MSIAQGAVDIDWFFVGTIIGVIMALLFVFWLGGYMIQSLANTPPIDWANITSLEG